MAQFQFRDGLILDFGVAKYEVTPDDPEFLEVYTEECNRISDIAGKIQTKKNIVPGDIRSACAEIIKSLDAILGENAIEEIFADRPIGVYDLIDVFRYIQDEFSTYKEERTGIYAPNVIPMNREQRRQASRKVNAEAEKK